MDTDMLCLSHRTSSHIQDSCTDEKQTACFRTFSLLFPTKHIKMTTKREKYFLMDIFKFNSL